MTGINIEFTELEVDELLHVLEDSESEHAPYFTELLIVAACVSVAEEIGEE